MRALEERPLQPAVDDDRLAADVARPVGGEEADDVAELLRRPPAAQRDLRELLLGRPAGVELVESRGRDAPWRHAVDGNAARAELVGERLQVPVDRESQ